MQPTTHLAISTRLCGTPRALREGSAEVELTASEEMRADARGLVHGGFLFGLADYAAMLAINAPNVVLGSAETRFLAPVVVGESLLATARVTSTDGKKHQVEVHVSRGLDRVFEGNFVCFVPSRHVLEPRGNP
ncbi:MAG TPA: hotdog domain-containing protein [Polyangiales bacterium]|nr:hotdog domain-containing protein [Polyangiales bacterium]